MTDWISLTSNILALLAAIGGIFSAYKGRVRLKNILLGGALLLLSVSTVVLGSVAWRQAGPFVTIVTKVEPGDSGYFSGRQQQFYAYPGISGLTRRLEVRMASRNAKVTPPFSFSTFAICPDATVLAERKAKVLYTLKPANNSQCLVVSHYENTMGAGDGTIWHQPKGWVGYQYDLAKAKGAREVRIVLDMDERMPELAMEPRVAIFDTLNAKKPPPGITASGEDLIHNEFKPMRVVEGSDGRAWVASLAGAELPDVGWLVVRWKVRLDLVQAR